VLRMTSGHQQHQHSQPVDEPHDHLPLGEL
jgi:hypothetical protein